MRRSFWPLLVCGIVTRHVAINLLDFSSTRKDMYMSQPTAFAKTIMSFALFGLVSLSSLAPALAAPVTDTFLLTLTGTERCRNDPKFVEPIRVKAKEGVTITFTRDVLGTDPTDVQAKFNNSGNATIDAITLNGRAFLTNKSGSIAQLALSGRDQDNADRFFTIRGQATFNKAGKLTKLTGTFVYQILSESGGVPDVDCFGSGTFATQKLPSAGGGGGGTLTVTGAPARVGGTFVSNIKVLGNTLPGLMVATVVWGESTLSLGHVETMQIFFDRTNGQVLKIEFVDANPSNVGAAWNCQSTLPSGCAGASVDGTAGTFTVVNTVLDILLGTAAPITLNGTLHFTPF